jgi:pyruvate dehydrogenase (quinone)
MSNCDTLLMVGSSFPYSEWLPEPGQARGVQIDLDARLIGMRYPMEVNLVGDAADTLRALIPLLQRKTDRAWREEVEGNVERWWRILAEQAHQPADPINPQLVFHELSDRLPDGAILTADSGSATDWWARHIRFREGMQAGLSGTLATMCPAIPYALAAKFAHPDKPVIASIGDGAMQMLGINALIDIAHYAEQWADQRLVIAVLNNHDLNQVTWEQRVMSGDAKLNVSQTLPDFDYAGYARLVGLHGERVDDPEQIGAAWDRALAAGKPALIEFVTDPEVPPLPPHIRFEQAQHMAMALKGDPHRGRIMKESIKGKVEELIHR